MVFIRVLVVGNCLSTIVTYMIFVCVLVVGDCLATEITDMIFICIFVIRDCLATEIADMIFICIFVIGNCFAAIITDMIFVRVLVVGNCLSTIVADMIFVRVCALAQSRTAVITFVVFICIAAILRLYACDTSVNGTFARVRAITVRCPFTVSMPVVDRYGHLGAVARLVGDNNLLLAVRRSKNKAVVFVKRDRCSVYGNGINVLFVNGDRLRFAIDLAFLNAGDNGACSVKHNAFRADIRYISRRIGQSYIDNILVIGIDVKGAVILGEGRGCKLDYCHLPTGQQVFDLNLLTAVVGCVDGNGLGFFKEQSEGDVIKELVPSVCADNDFTCRLFDIPPLGSQGNAFYAVVGREIGINGIGCNELIIVCPSDKFIGISKGSFNALKHLVGPFNICFIGNIGAAVGIKFNRIVRSLVPLCRQSNTHFAVINRKIGINGIAGNNVIIVLPTGKVITVSYGTHNAFKHLIIPTQRFTADL